MIKHSFSRTDIYDIKSIRLASEKEFVSVMKKCISFLFVFMLIIMLLPVRVSASEDYDGVYKTLDELEGKKIGVQQGTLYDGIVAERIDNIEICYYVTFADLLNALKTGKVDAIVAEEPSLITIRENDDSFTYIPEYLMEEHYACAFPKTEKSKALNAQFSEFVLKIKEDGTLNEIGEIWFGNDESIKLVPDYSTLTAENGTIKVATEAEYAPFEYIKDGQVVGYDFDILYRFCKEYGYGLDIQMMSFDAIFPTLATGKCDFAMAALGISEERKESVDYSEPYYVSRTIVVVLRKNKSSSSIFSSIATSFEKTFIRENRYKLFLAGIATTVLITFLSIIFGTILGFAVFMLCRNGNPVAVTIRRVCEWLIQGMPVVVLLMIFYYIVFADSSVTGTIVSIIVFTLVFGAAVDGLLRMGVGAVDKGQTEASYALGYNDISTFFKIILPQAVPHFLPGYKGEIVSLIKATAVVGYVAVQDLTKMGDIVRGRTYEAFFPLIVVAVIYFILGSILTFIVGRIEISVDPKKRKKEKILKGVKVDD